VDYARIPYIESKKLDEMKKLFNVQSLFIGFCFLFISSSPISASDNQYVTIVNPVRIASYTIDSSKSIAAEYQIIKNNSLPATWLLTYDVLEDEKAVYTIKKMDNKQEVGLFLEVGPSLCQKSEVTCNEGSWHHANVIFLSGYTQDDRKKLIDTLFSTFKETFGQYPKSVGSWWTDSYSLSYMQEKYGITANLTCSDQFATDGYEIWGQYWMYPYMPSRYHAGMPAIDSTNQLNLVTMQWAAREPLKGYESSLYSTQDYQTKPLDYTTEFFENLIKTYAFKHSNSFGQITVGLEGDFNPKDYEGEYKNQIQTVKQYVDKGLLEPVTMSQFSDWYRKSFTITAPTFVQSDKVNDSSVQSYWYQSLRYRMNILYNSTNQKTTIRDLRTYHSDFIEPYYSSPNTYQKLTINIPSYFDAMSNKENVWDLELGKIISIENNEGKADIQFEKGSITFDPNSFTINQKSIQIPQILKNSQSVNITTSKDSVIFTPKDHWRTKDTVYYALSEVTLHELERKRTKVILIVGILLLLFGLFRLVKSDRAKRTKIGFFCFCVLFIAGASSYWYRHHVITYSVSQSEIDILNHLKNMTSGKVLVYDHECLGCNWTGELKPASYANQKGYIAKYGGHSIIYNKDIFEEKDLVKAKEKFKQLNPTYIYLTRYEGFEEKMPFSPGDFNIEKIYESANGELWRVKD